MKRLLIGSLAALLFGLGGQATQAYSSATEQWRPVVESACADQSCVEQIMWLISCESGGNPYATHPNPNGGTDVGLLQINDLTWGDVAYADGATQIIWTASHLDTVWWACEG